MRVAALALDGVVYCSVFNPTDGRKYRDDLITAFVWAFRDRVDATLIVKATHADPAEAVLLILAHVGRLGRVRCRVIVVYGLLTDESQNSPVEATSYCVNTSQGEGQCLPLMEFMSAGRPAVAPDHSAMRDYVAHANTFVVESVLRSGSWPHDERQAFRCLRSELRFDGILRAYRESFRVAREDGARYAAMSDEARRVAALLLRRSCRGTIGRSVRQPWRGDAIAPPSVFGKPNHIGIFESDALRALIPRAQTMAQRLRRPYPDRGSCLDRRPRPSDGRHPHRHERRGRRDGVREEQPSTARHGLG